MWSSTFTLIFFYFFLAHTDSSSDESVSVAKRVKMVMCLFIDQLKIISSIITACVLHYCGEFIMYHNIFLRDINVNINMYIIIIDKFCSHSEGVII